MKQYCGGNGKFEQGRYYKKVKQELEEVTLQVVAEFSENQSVQAAVRSLSGIKTATGAILEIEPYCSKPVHFPQIEIIQAKNSQQNNSNMKDHLLDQEEDDEDQMMLLSDTEIIQHQAPVTSASQTRPNITQSQSQAFIQSQIAQQLPQNSDYIYLSISGFEFTPISRLLIYELLGFAIPLKRLFIEGDTAHLELPASAKSQEVISELFMNDSQDSSQPISRGTFELLNGDILTIEIEKEVPHSFQQDWQQQKAKNVIMPEVSSHLRLQEAAYQNGRSRVR